MSEELPIFVGSRVRIRGEWHQPTNTNKIPDINDPFADPSALAVKVYKPGHSFDEFVYLTDPEVVRDSQGKYHVDYIPDTPGQYRYVWIPTGNAAQPTDGRFYADTL